MKRAYLGIDPGFGGGIACIRGRRILYLARMPSYKVEHGKGHRSEYSLHEIWDIFKSLMGRYDLVAAVEGVDPNPAMGAIPNFHLGRGRGVIEMALVGQGIPFEYLRPAEWRKAVGLPNSKDKRKSIATVSRMYPKSRDEFKRVTVDDGKAEAVLIATALRRIDRGR